MKCVRSLTVLAVLSCGISGAAQANLLVNGSFEDVSTGVLVVPNQGPDTTPANGIASGQWAVFSSIPGWVAGAGTRGIEVRNNVAGTAHSGVNFVELDSHPGPGSNSSMSQAFGNFAAGTLLNLSFYYAARPNTVAATNGIQVFWNGNDVSASILPTNPSSGTLSTSWSLYTAQLTAIPGSNTLGFAAVGTDDTVGGSLDSVSVTVVPEPEAYGLALAGMGVVAFAMRRQRAHPAKSDAR